MSCCKYGYRIACLIVLLQLLALTAVETAYDKSLSKTWM